MRFTAFVIGGILGALAAALWIRNRGNLRSVMSLIGLAGRMANRMKDNVRDSMQETVGKAMDLAMSRGLRNEAENAGGAVRH